MNNTEQKLDELFTSLLNINQNIVDLVQAKKYDEFNTTMEKRTSISEQIIKYCTENDNQKNLENLSHGLQERSKQLLHSDEQLIKHLELEIQKLHGKRDRMLFINQYKNFQK